MNGLTAEINNTDAEGRLVLGDCLTYLQREYKPRQVVDLATLTGACMIALGHETAGLFVNDDEILNEIKAAGISSFEPVWHLPITEEHKTLIKGKYGDIMNTGGIREGGASTAASFLMRFQGDTKWAHIDIAGPAMSTPGKQPLCPDQTGFGAQLLLHLLRNKENK